MNNQRRKTLRKLGWMGAAGLVPWLASCGGGAAAGEGDTPSGDGELESGADRRGGSSGGSGGSTSAVPAAPAGAPHVVVVGGGMGGATLAKYLRMWSNGAVAVTLVDRDPGYLTCIHSSLVLTGQRTLAALTRSRAALASRWGVRLVQGEVTAVDPATRTVRLADNTQLTGQRLVLAPGLDFDRIAGLELDADFEANPHAWKAGPQTTTLAAQLRAMPAGGSFVMTIPAAPYRCPPGPYERASVVADWLKRNKPGSKVIVLDANPGITAESATFTRAFNVTHAGVVQYVPNVAIDRIDAASKTVRTALHGDFRASVLNPIPPQRAPRLLAAAGLVNANGRWAGVDPLSYESLVAPGVYVIGDSSFTGGSPKSGHIANQQAKVCADAIIRQLRGLPLDPAPVTSSACFSTVTMTTASWLNANFAYDPATRAMKVVPESLGESTAADADGWEDMEKWFSAIMNDTFA